MSNAQDGAFVDEDLYLVLLRQAGRCGRPDPESPAGQLPFRCELPPGHTGLCADYTYSMITHDGISHPGPRLGVRRRW